MTSVHSWYSKLPKTGHRNLVSRDERQKGDRHQSQQEQAPHYPAQQKRRTGQVRQTRPWASSHYSPGVKKRVIAPMNNEYPVVKYIEDGVAP